VAGDGLRHDREHRRNAYVDNVGSAGAGLTALLEPMLWR
jgi:hypothetical protein